METYHVDLHCEIPSSFRTQKAANSLDIDIEKKSRHELKVTVDLKTPFTVGLIVGSSGSGKTTLAKKMFGVDCFKEHLDPTKPVIDQFPATWSYDQCAEALSGIGLTSVPCWMRPAYTLSNGQKARAEAALALASDDMEMIIIDEWTSVVDRTAAKVMSFCLAKYARRTKKKIILVSCHYDVIEWLDPCFIIDCNKREYTDRRNKVGVEERTDRLRFDIKEVDRSTWKYFSKYHYLSEKLPGGKIYCFGIFHGREQIGFGCYAAYVPGRHDCFFSNRVVIHPDFCGFGLGLKFVNATAAWMVNRGFQVKAKFSSIPLYRARMKDPHWKLTSVKKFMKATSFGSGYKSRNKTFRAKVVTYSFDYVGHRLPNQNTPKQHEAAASPA